MTIDVARVSFQPSMPFSTVLLQQGRLLLEADFNEQAAIHHYYLRQLICDAIGKEWAAGDGFEPNLTSDSPSELKIQGGHIYVRGILCESQQEYTYASQPYFSDTTKLPKKNFVAYLEVFEQEITHVYEPNIREPALGGPDSAGRTRIIWQLRVETADQLTEKLKHIEANLKRREQDFPKNLVFKSPSFPESQKTISDLLVNIGTAEGSISNNLFSAAPTNAQRAGSLRSILEVLNYSRPILRAEARFDEPDPDPCTIASDADYRGRENQLYRVQIHNGGSAKEATFKWSRENASVIFGVREVSVEADQKVIVQLETLGRDRRYGLCEGDWVELTSNELELRGEVFPLLRVETIDRGRRTVVLESSKSGIPYDQCSILRRWDQTDVDSTDPGKAGTKRIVESTKEWKVARKDWLSLERGVRVQFAPGGIYKSGDYWLIPARVATADVEWPRHRDVGPTGEEQTKAKFKEADGIKIHRASIAVGVENAGAGMSPFSVFDCRSVVDPIAPNRP